MFWRELFIRKNVQKWPFFNILLRQRYNEQTTRSYAIS